MESAWSKERLYAKAEELGGFGHWTRDFEKDEGIWSEGMCRIFGIAGSELQPSFSFFLSFVHPDDRQAVQSGVLTAISSNTQLDIEYRITRPDGTPRVIHSVAEVVYGAGSRPVGLFGVVRDITHRNHPGSRKNRPIEAPRSPACAPGLGTLLHICAYCKKVRNEGGLWQPLEAYMQERAGTEFSHGICPQCLSKCSSEYYCINSEDLRDED